MAKRNNRYSIMDALTLLRQVPFSVYIFPVLVAMIAYVLLGTAVWLLATPYWKELAGEWDVIGKYVAIVVWVVCFPIVFNLILSMSLGLLFDPLASKLDLLLHSSDYKRMSVSQQWIDSVVRTGFLLLLHAVAIIVAAMIPVAGLAISGAASVISALVLVTTPAVVHRGLSFSSHIKLIVAKFGPREFIFGILAAILLSNPLLQVVALVPLIVIGQIMTRNWLMD
jgi:hypothetical protein